MIPCRSGPGITRGSAAWGFAGKEITEEGFREVVKGIHGLE